MIFELRGKLPGYTKIYLEISGFLGFLAIWSAVSVAKWLPMSILPPPWRVLTAFRELFYEDALIQNAIFSIKLNALGYLEAIALALPIGFLIGLFPFFRGLLERYVTALRYLPLTAAMGLFIAWFGIEVNMKVQFLAFGIFVYLLPVVAQRVYETPQVYVDTVRTLGASSYQTIKYVFVPDVLSRVFDDIRVLVAISWTYIIIAEVINSSSGGIGALAYISARQSRMDKVFAILVVIMLIGFVQDKVLSWADRQIFRHKYA